MASENGREPPFLIAGGGIGGLAAAYALARRGFPVRVFEQSAEFREVGAGIQLGPNIFRALDRIGLKDEMLIDAWQPGKLEMRDALTGELVTSVPLGAQFLKNNLSRPGTPVGAETVCARLPAEGSDRRIFGGM